MTESVKNFLIFRGDLCALSETAKDTANMEYLTKVETSVLNFDDVKERYLDNLGLSIGKVEIDSVDALTLLDGRWAFIEFKNGVIDSRKRQNLHAKVKDSLLIFCDITGKPLSFTRENMDLYIVYNEGKNPSHKEKIWDKFAGWAEQARFGLEKFKTLYFHDVHTYTGEQFKAAAARIEPVFDGV